MNYLSWAPFPTSLSRWSRARRFISRMGYKLNLVRAMIHCYIYWNNCPSFTFWHPTPACGASWSILLRDTRSRTSNMKEMSSRVRWTNRLFIAAIALCCALIVLERPRKPADCASIMNALVIDMCAVSSFVNRSSLMTEYSSMTAQPLKVIG